jgi:hypothetical protein
MRTLWLICRVEPAQTKASHDKKHTQDADTKSKSKPSAAASASTGAGAGAASAAASASSASVPLSAGYVMSESEYHSVSPVACVTPYDAEALESGDVEPESFAVVNGECARVSYVAHPNKRPGGGGGGGALTLHADSLGSGSAVQAPLDSCLKLVPGLSEWRVVRVPPESSADSSCCAVAVDRCTKAPVGLLPIDGEDGYDYNLTTNGTGSSAENLRDEVWAPLLALWRSTAFDRTKQTLWLTVRHLSSVITTAANTAPTHLAPASVGYWQVIGYVVANGVVPRGKQTVARRLTQK